MKNKTTGIRDTRNMDLLLRKFKGIKHSQTMQKKMYTATVKTIKAELLKLFRTCITSLYATDIRPGSTGFNVCLVGIWSKLGTHI